MVVSVVCGAMISVGHHFYYSSLDNTLVNSVDQPLRRGVRCFVGCFLLGSMMVGTLRKASAMFDVISNEMPFSSLVFSMHNDKYWQKVPSSRNRSRQLNTYPLLFQAKAWYFFGASPQRRIHLSVMTLG
jgi:hypothetical protein